MGKRVCIALSGGVDSAVATELLLRQGYQVFGVTMKLQEQGFEKEIESAKEVAEFLGISHFVLDLSGVFKRDVIQPWLEAYENGETPNPCQFCNPAVKYGALMNWAFEQGADYFATGHYARLKRDDQGLVHLIQGENEKKDQGYVLCRLSQKQLQRLIFPLGEFSSKEAVRALAEKRGIPVFEKKDSMGICFIPNGDHLTYLARYAPSVMTPGPVRDSNGKIVGRHQGLARYTIGQKRGLQRWTKNGGSRVVRIDAQANTLWVGDESELWTDQIRIRDLQWIVSLNPNKKIWIRCCQWGSKTQVRLINSHEIQLIEPVRAPAPGQAVAIYQGKEVVGSALIKG